MWNKGNVNTVNTVDTLAANEFVRFGRINQSTIHGKDAFKEYVSKIRKAYTDLKLDIENVTAKQDKVTRTTSPNCTIHAGWRS